MKYKTIVVLVLTMGLIIFPKPGLAAAAKTFTGIVTGISGSQIVFTNGTAATYSAEVGSAGLMRKNGAPMQFLEIIVGDKIQVSGILWSDNSISASSVKDLSLYAHNSTFSGKIISINPGGSAFTMQSKTYGIQNISTNNFTAFTKNGSTSTFKDLELGMTATVKGMWDRTSANVVATQIKGTLKLIKIYFTGTISLKITEALTVLGNGNVIYGVDVSHAKLENKSTKPAALSQYNIGDTVRVWGEHVSGSVQIYGAEIKDSSFSN